MFTEFHLPKIKATSRRRCKSKRKIGPKLKVLFLYFYYLFVALTFLVPNQACHRYAVARLIFSFPNTTRIAARKPAKNCFVALS